ALLAACVDSSGGSSGPASLPAPGPGQAQKAITVTLAIPGNTPQGVLRKPQYVSPNTQSITIAVASVNGVAPVPLPTPTVFAIAAPACTTTAPIKCNFTMNVPSATSVVLTISAFASTNGTGTPLSTGLTQSVNTTLANPTFNASLGGTPASVIFTVGSSTTPITTTSISTATTLQLHVTALDASNAVIIGSTTSPPPYSSPITLTMTGDPSHDLSLSTATMTTPGSAGGATTFPITYAPASIGTQLTSVSLVAAIAGKTVGSLTINPLNLITSATGLTTLINGGPASTIAVQEYGNTGAFTLAGPGNFATVTCAPASCAPSTPGGSVTLTVAPAVVTGPSGPGVLTITDATGTSLGVNVVVTGATSGSITVPPTLPIREFTVPTTTSGPTGITVGPTGTNIWFTENTVGRVGKLFVQSCTKTSPYTCPIVDEPLLGSVTANGIATGSDGNIWVAVFNASSGGSIERVTTSSGCATTTSLACPVDTPVPYIAHFAMTPDYTGLATGSDGSLYYAYDDASSGYPSGVGAILAPVPTASPQSLAVSLPTPSPEPNPQTLAVGPDRNMWFTDSAVGGGIGTVTCSATGCSATEYYGNLGSVGTQGIVAAPDGYLYVSEGTSNAIARILPANCTGAGSLASCAVQQTIPTTGSVYGLAVGSDGNVWYADPGTGPPASGSIGVVVLSTCVTACIVHEYPIPSGHVAANLVRGPDGNIWFTETSGNAIGEVVLH
ncbi:MAG: virginiamycin B lyase family protein, partial [Vulcanimicrobiaceae bacterium]